MPSSSELGLATREERAMARDRMVTSFVGKSRAGEHFVEAELHRRGAYSVTFAGNMLRIDNPGHDTEQFAPPPSRSKR